MAPPVHRYGTRPGRRFHHHRARLTPRLPSLCSAGPKAQYCKSCDEPIKAATDVAYDCIKEKLLRIVNTKFGTGKLILIGGIQINLPKPYATRRVSNTQTRGPTPPHPPLPLLSPCRYEDHFQPKFFQVLGEGCAPVDLLPELAPPAPKKD